MHNRHRIKNCLLRLETYCNKWQIELNKLLFLTPLDESKFYFQGKLMEIVKSYCYLGVVKSYCYLGVVKSYCYLGVVKSYCYLGVVKSYCYLGVVKSYCYLGVVKSYCYLGVVKSYCYLGVVKSYCYLGVVKSYCYLGVSFVCSGTNKTARTNLAEKARKVMFFYQLLPNLSCDKSIKLFQSIVRPIVLYNSENLAHLTLLH